MPFGRQLLSANSVYPTRVSFDGSPSYKGGGITIDLTTIPAASGTDITLTDGSIIKAGFQFLRYGQVMTKITNTGTDVVTINGAPTGGTFTISVVDALGTIQTTSAIAFNATAATVQAAVQALSNVGANKATVTGSAGGPYTIVFDNTLGATTVTASGASLTGGTTPSATVVATAPGGDVGKFGPYDPAATDGRATLTRGECFVLDQTLVFATGAGYPLPGTNDIQGRAIDGGAIWLDRVIQSGVATHTLAAGPTKAEFLAAFPLFQIAEN